MRVTESMKSMTIVSHLNRNAEEMLKYQNQISSGKQLQHASDDPVGTSKILYFKEIAAQNERYQQNIEDAKLWFVATEVALNGTFDIMSQANNIALQGSNDTLGRDERRLLKEQVQLLLEQMVSFANRRNGSLYLFGGTVTSGSPYELTDEVSDESFISSSGNAVELDNVLLKQGSVVVTSADGTITFSEGTDYVIDYDLGTITVVSSADGGTMSDATEYLISYNTQNNTVLVENDDGNEGQINREISQGNVVQINTSGTDAFTADVDVFAVLKNLKNALYRNDTTNIRSTVEFIQNGSEQIAKEQGEVGLRYEVLDSTLEDLKSYATQIEYQRSKIEDTDIAEAIVQLDAKNLMYEATLKSSSTIFKQSLIDFIG